MVSGGVYSTAFPALLQAVILVSWSTALPSLLQAVILVFSSIALPALTTNNVTKVCVGANVVWTEEFCALLGIPRTQVEKLQQIACLQDRLRDTVEYWLSVDHAPSWRRIIAAVDFWNEFYTLSMRLHEFAGPISGRTLYVTPGLNYPIQIS